MMAKKTATIDPLEAVRQQAAAARDAVLDRLEPLRDKIADLKDQIVATENSLPSRAEIEERVGWLMREIRGNVGTLSENC